MNSLCSKQFTPYFNPRHSKSISFLIPDQPPALQPKPPPQHLQYRNIHKKFSENKIDTLDNVLAVTEREEEEEKEGRLKKGERKVLSNVLQPRNGQRKRQRTSLSSIPCFSSEERADCSLSHKRRNISASQISQISIILHTFLRESQDAMVNLSKLVLWTEGKLTEIIEHIYSQIFKNAQEAARLTGTSPSLESVQNIVRRSLLKKYKTEKLMRQNLVNIVYSLQSHLANKKGEENGGGRYEYFLIFEDLLKLKISSEDLLFWLYARKVAEDLLGSTQRFKIIISQSSLYEYLFIITHGIQDHAQHYLSEAVKSFGAKFSIPLYTFLSFLVRAYQQNRCRVKIEASQRRAGSSLPSIPYEFDESFWSLHPPPFLASRTSTLAKEIEYQSKRLVQMLCGGLSIEYRAFVKELLAIKGAQIVERLQRPNGKTLLKDLGLGEMPNDQKARCLNILQHIREELSYIRSIPESPLVEKPTVKFSKFLLTAPFLTAKLYQLVEYFHRLSHPLPPVN